MNTYNIRRAVSTDTSAILALQSSSVLRSYDQNNKWNIQKKGFLLGDYTDKQCQNDINRKLFLVAETEIGIIGYIRIDDKPDYQDNDKKIWFDSSKKEEYYKSPHIEIGAIVVNESFSGHGISSALLLETEKQLKAEKNQYLFSIVAISPLFNLPSIAFHEKSGFNRISMSLPQSVFGLRNYQSVLYCKELSL